MRLLAAAQGRRCYLCGERLRWFRRWPENATKPSLDHVRPVKLGGQDRPGNLLACHRRCNVLKDCRPPHPCELIFLSAVNARLGVML